MKQNLRIYSTADNQYFINNLEKKKAKKTQTTTQIMEKIIKTRLKIKDPVSGHSLVRFQSNQN